MKKVFILLFIVVNICVHAQIVKIAAAGNLRFILNEIIEKYKSKNLTADIIANYGASGVLFQQISHGADFDIFMAADKEFPDKLKAQGLTSGDVKTYAFGKLVLWSNTVDVSKGIKVLKESEIKHIAIAKPEVAPYGERAVECLKFYKLYEEVKDKIVYADNIAQAAQYTQTGNAEAGFIAMALALSPEMKGTYYKIDQKSYKPVEQAMVLLKNKEMKAEAVKFMSYILSRECGPIFKKYGFKVP